MEPPVLTGALSSPVVRSLQLEIVVQAAIVRLRAARV